MSGNTLGDREMGGRKKNKTDSACRCRHRPSGAIGESSESRSQLQNKRMAFKKMANSIEMRSWINKRISEIKDGQSVEQWVEDQMKPENLKIEVKEGGKWTETKKMME